MVIQTHAQAARYESTAYASTLQLLKCAFIRVNRPKQCTLFGSVQRRLPQAPAFGNMMDEDILTHLICSCNLIKHLWITGKEAPAPFQTTPLASMETAHRWHTEEDLLSY